MTTPLETAKQYIARGWCVVPVPHREKNPSIKEWQKLRITTDTAPQHFNGKAQNIGVQLGEPSGWLVDLDMDWPEAVRLARHFCPETLTFGREGNPRSHALVRCVGAATKKFSLSDKDGGMILELRSTGSQTVFPGSHHRETGELIKFENDAQIVETERRPLETRCAQWAAAALLLHHWTEGHRDNLAVALGGALLRGSWKPEDVDTYIGWIAAEAHDDKLRERLKAERLKEKLDAGTGHVPGLPKLREILGAHTADKLGEWLGLKREAEEEQKPLLPHVLSARELSALDLPPRDEIVSPWLLLPSLVLIWAMRGLGKTWFALEMGRLIATGQKFLAWDVPKARRVLYVDGEMPLADLKQRLQLLCGAALPEGLDFLPSELLFRDGTPLNLNSIVHQARIIELLDALANEGRAPEVVIFDNLSSLAGGTDENSNSEIESLLRFLIGLRHRGLAVVLVHHAKKGGEDQRGASRREDLLDTSIRLAPPEDAASSPQMGAHFVVTFTKTRGPRPAVDVADVQLITGPDGRLMWTVTAAGRPAPARWLQALKAVADNPGVPKKQIAEQLGMKPSVLSQSLNKAREKELLDKNDVVTERGHNYLAAVFRQHVAAKGDDDAPF